MKALWRFIVGIFFSTRNIINSISRKTIDNRGIVFYFGGQAVSTILALIATFLICSGAFLASVTELLLEKTKQENKLSISNTKENTIYV